jgi:hypothetical protein
MVCIFLRRILTKFLEKAQVKSTRNWRKCMKNLMKLEESKAVIKDRSKLKQAISVYSNGKRA